MATMFAFAESRGGELRKVAFEAVTAARQRGRRQRGRRGARAADGRAGHRGQAEELGRYGADVVVVVEHAGLERYNPEAFAATAAERLSGRATTAPRSSRPRPRAATWPRGSRRELGVGLASDVTEFELQGDAVLAQHPGIHRQGDRHPAAHRLSGAGLAAARGHHRRRAAAHGAGRDRRSRRSIPRRRAWSVTETDAAHGRAKLDLGEAPVIVSGGRGLRARGEFQAGGGAGRRVRQRRGGRDPRRHRRRLAARHRSDRSDRAGGEPRSLRGAWASRARSSTWPGCARRRPSSRSTRTRTRRSSRSRTTGSWVTCSRSCRG